MEENPTPQAATESELLEHCLPQAEAEMLLNQICGITPDAAIKSLQVKFQMALLDELLFENFGITDSRKATMKQIGKCLKQIKELDQIITDGKAKKL
jgi:hypothetical protein